MRRKAFSNPKWAFQGKKPLPFDLHKVVCSGRYITHKCAIFQLYDRKLLPLSSIQGSMELHSCHIRTKECHLIVVRWKGNNYHTDCVFPPMFLYFFPLFFRGPTISLEHVPAHRFKELPLNLTPAVKCINCVRRGAMLQAPACQKQTLGVSIRLRQHRLCSRGREKKWLLPEMPPFCLNRVFT